MEQTGRSEMTSADCNAACKDDSRPFGDARSLAGNLLSCDDVDVLNAAGGVQHVCQESCDFNVLLLASSLSCSGQH